jgi:hypothetical protein
MLLRKSLKLTGEPLMPSSQPLNLSLKALMLSNEPLNRSLKGLMLSIEPLIRSNEDKTQFICHKIQLIKYKI